MDKLRQAAEQALETLENSRVFVTSREKTKHPEGTKWYDDCIEALRQALAQPEQEPFEYWNAVEGWVKIDEVRQHFDSVGCGTIYKTAGENRVPLYTAPPKREWVWLTDEEIITHFQTNVDTGSLLSFADGVRYAEAKLKEKNT